MAHTKKHPNPGIEVGYALDFISVIRHVATKLDEAPDGMTVGGLAIGYRGFPADLGRVRLHHHLKNDRAAIEFLVDRAVRALGTQVHTEGDRIFLAKPFDELRYERRPIARDVQSKFRDPFNPLKADGFADNIRGNGRDDTTELSGSLQTFGWIKEFPAIQDERGVTLVGHRRLKVAEELGIEPVVKTMNLGQGDEADAYRLRLAIASNLGSKPFGEADKRRIAEYLYGEKGWTMVRIGEAIMVSHQTVGRLLQGLSTVDKPPRPNGGRPKNLTPEQEQMVIENYHEFGGTMTIKQVADFVGVNSKNNSAPTSITKVIDIERGRRQGVREAEERAQRASSPSMPVAVSPLADEPELDTGDSFRFDPSEAPSELALGITGIIEEQLRAPFHELWKILADLHGRPSRRQDEVSEAWDEFRGLVAGFIDGHIKP